MGKYRFETKEVIMTALGIVLFLIMECLQQYLVSIGIMPEWAFEWIRFRMPVLMVMSAVFGPIVGVLIGFAGAILVEIIFIGQVYIAEVFAYVVIGYIVGRFCKYFEVLEGNFWGLKILDFTMVQLMSMSMMGALFYPLILFLYEKNNLMEACELGMKRAGGNILLIAVTVTPILIIISRVNRKRKSFF